jgi:hypothetical protein
MTNLENLRAFLVSHQPKKGSKTFTVRGIEEKLNLPTKTLDHFIAARRGLGDFEAIVESFFANLGYDENTEYGQILSGQTHENYLNNFFIYSVS